jgi:putative DNA primase/helicase
MTDYTVEEIKDKVDIVDVIGSYINLKKQGSEYVALCPFHDEKTPSFTVNQSKQIYYCFGCGAGSSVLDFVMEYEGVDLAEGVKIIKQKAGLIEEDGRKIEKPVKQVIEKPLDPMDDWQAIMPVPTTAPKLMDGGRTIPVYNPKSEKETVYTPEQGGVYAYREKNGALLGAVLRVYIGGKKLTPTITYCANKNTGEERWVLKGFPEPRPLYYLDELGSCDSVLVVEGEKCADLAYNHAGKVYDIISWPMGTNSVDRVDWSPLYGKEVSLWADNDVKEYKQGQNKGKIKPEDEQNGRKAMVWIKKHLEENGCSVTLLDQPDDKPDGWDCADAVDEGVDLIQYIVDHTPIVETYNNDEEPEQQTAHEHRSEIVPLGYDEGRFYYYSKFTKQIKMLRDRDHGKTSLLGLAPIEWWLSKFDNGKGKVEWDECISYLMQSCRSVGIFDARRLRGRGCWFDDSRFVLHLGERLIVNGESIELGSFKTNFVYQAAARKKIPVNALTNTEAKGLIEAAKAFDWDMPASAALLAGWCVLAPICGALEWRPHMWINGGSGSGKSTITKIFTKSLVGDFGVYLSLNSSVAGLRQTLGSDAFPVLIEEFDPKNKSTKEKAQEYFDMMRDASDDNETPTLRGSSSGEATAYSTNSMFYLVGVQLCTNEQAVLNRTAVLSLKSRPDRTDQQRRDNIENWAKIQDIIDKNILSINNLSTRLLARTIGMIDIIIANIKTFRKAANKHFGNARHADQYGTLLAGAYSLTSDCKIQEDVALKYIEHYDWEVYTEDSDEDESILALKSILQVRLRVETDGAPRTYTVIEAIETVKKQELNHVDVGKELRRFGIIVSKDGFIHVSNTSSEIKTALAGLPWGTNWGKYLKRIIGPNGEKSISANSMSYGGVSAKGSSIPMSILFDESEEVEQELDF